MQSDKTQPRRRLSRGLPDLEALFEQVDSQAAAPDQSSPSGAAEGLADLAALGRAAAPEITPSPDKTGSPQTSATAQGSLSAPDEGGLQVASEDEEDSDGRLRVPPDLEAYLSPDLWRKLMGLEPSRGVLFNALERVRSVLYLLSTFLPNHLVQEKMRRPFPGLVNGQVLNGSLLFSDVSGFTALSERLAVFGPEGAEKLTEIMNRYFARMLEILAWSGGILLKFAGDAMLVYFPEQENGEQANWAVRAGQRMLRAMSDFARIETPSGVESLRMKIGLASGEFLAASVGSEQRMEYILLGDAVTQTMSAEGMTTGGGQLVINAATVQHLSSEFATRSLEGGYALVQLTDEQALDEFEIKAETRRARGVIPWSASPQAILTQVEVALRQIKALTPFLASELVDRIVVYARQRQVKSQYRPTTVMFCNFTGPEWLLRTWGAAGSPRVTSLLSAYVNAMQEVITHYGGIISRVDPYSKGTKMLVLFGAPVAHEDDPQRAVSAALAMNAELEMLEENWRQKFARHLPAEASQPLIQHRIGITFGESIFAGEVGSTTRREYTVMGDEVNLAARLMGAAEMGQILLDVRIQNSVEDYFVLAPLPPIRVKGKSRPLAVFQVNGPREDTLANRAHCRELLIGREAEIARGEAILRQVSQGKTCGLILTGPAGIGKSHLADELLNRAEDMNFSVYFNQCHAYQAETPYGCWSVLLRMMAGITSMDYQPEAHLQKLRGLLSGLGISPVHLTPLASLLGLRSETIAEPAREKPVNGEEASSSDILASRQPSDLSVDFIRQGHAKRRGSSLDLWDQLDQKSGRQAGASWRQGALDLNDGERDSLHRALAALLSGLAGQKPVAIFFEDAHWMDAESLGLLRYLSQSLGDAAVLFLLAQRDEQTPGEPISTSTEVINLSPLPPSSTTDLVAYLLVSDLAQVIHEQSRGNPLFVSEITRWFMRTRQISAQDLRDVLQTSNVLQKLVLSGLETLPEAQREVARVASVIGNEFRTSEVQALLSASMDAVTLSNHLRALRRERLISLTEAGADARYAFQQTLVRDILYSSLPYEQRRELHARLAAYLSLPAARRSKIQARIAAALEIEPGTTLVQDAGRVAYHYEQAGNWLQAAQHLKEAGVWSVQHGLVMEAPPYFSRALTDLSKVANESITSEVMALKTSLYLGQGDAAVISADYLLAATAYENGRSCLEADSSPEVRAEILHKLALVLPTQGKAGEAISLLRQAFKTPEQAENPAVIAVMAWLLWRSGKAEMHRWSARFYELLPEQVGVWASGVMALLAEMSGEWQKARDGYVSLGRKANAAMVLLEQGDWRLEQEDLDGAMEAYRQAGEYWCEEPQLIRGLALAFYRQAEVEWRRQDFQAALSALQQAQAALLQDAPLLQAGGQEALPRALKRCTDTKKNRSGSRRWPVWRWQVYKDGMHIPILFQP
ncbi:MAG: AAA family ATPase [Anaerolineales bacterium]|nr:AAA family ATPase [Anaerolineales bacterium]